MSDIIKAKDSQFQLSNTGEILYQHVLNNPLPGRIVARLSKGDGVLSPKVLFESDDAKVQGRISEWLQAYMKEVLVPLYKIQNPEGDIPEPVQAIFQAVFENFGIVHRTQLRDVIKTLEPEQRAPIRSHRVMMGPLFVYLPELNKPAQIGLKSVLWSLFNERPLPAPKPADGVVSFVIDPETVDRKYHEMVGYPVFASRAIRIDMLERVVTKVYDSAKDGKFQAQHQMAEWLGCPLEDLYAVLRAMGHKQIKMEEVGEKIEDSAIEKTEGEKEVKPPLPWFWIKSGKASEKPVRKNPAPKKSGKPDEKPARKGGKKDFKKKKTSEPQVYSFEAKKSEGDNPFAALQALKKK